MGGSHNILYMCLHAGQSAELFRDTSETERECSREREKRKTSVHTFIVVSDYMGGCTGKWALSGALFDDRTT